MLAIPLGLAAALGVSLGFFLTYLGEIPLVSDLKAYTPSLSTKFYDAHGAFITELFAEQRTLIKLEEVPQSLQQAILAIEDNNFYQHFGIQFSGILRSALVNFLHKSYQQGGSTITQQLARNMFLTRRKTMERKIKEMILALQIERTYTKPEILEMYLNQIYFGNGAYGVESAARAYFGKHVQELSLSECALLAGLPRAPNNYNPYRYLERSLGRRNVVLAQMQRLGYITPEAAVEAKSNTPTLASVEISEAPYFVEYVRRQLEDRYGSNAVYKGGLKVFTSLDLSMQQAAQDVVNQGMLLLDNQLAPLLRTMPGQRPETIQCSLLLLDPATGEIKAMIGGRNFEESKFNRAVQAQRQPGSAFKPFVYATAFQHGFTQADVILDTPVVMQDENNRVWKPENFGNKFWGPLTLRSALTHSRNVVTVKLLSKLGPQPVIETAQKMGIQSPLAPYLTLALGAVEVNLLELVSAYGCLPNRGIHVEPVSILRVEDSAGQMLEENTPMRQEALDEATSAILTNVMENVIDRGTGYTVRRLGFRYPAAGKTGTTNDFSDAWFIGFTSELVAGVWVGLDSHRSLGKGVTGGMAACPLWTQLMLKIYAQRAPRPFSSPDSVEQVNFCSVSGLLPRPGCEKYVTRGAFAIGTAPTQLCDVHGDTVEELPPAMPMDQVDQEGTTATSTSSPASSEEPPRRVLRNERPVQF